MVEVEVGAYVLVRWKEIVYSHMGLVNSCNKDYLKCLICLEYMCVQIVGLWQKLIYKIILLIVGIV
jgi:hypothetical protein